jgi:phenylacetate-CoA ligase
LAEAGIADLSDVSALGDLTAVPFFTKGDLREGYPFGLLAVPREQLVRVHASSGTHGQPTVVGYTRADLETWTELMARSMTMAGVRPGMVIHNANGYGLFTGGLGFHQGGERIGATVVPVSGGRTQRQAMLLRDFGAQVLVATPSYSLVIAQALADEGLDPESSPLELGLFGGEPWTEGLRAQIDRALGIKAINFYGLSEMCGPGVATECLIARDGLHVQEDHFLVEVIDPDDGTPVPPGTVGELVFTTLTKEALPLIRYRTGDLGAIIEEPCRCGRTSARLTQLGGRRDDMMIIRGVNLYPSHVEQILTGVDGVAPHWRLILERPGPMDELTLECEPASLDGDRARLKQTLEQHLKEGTGVRIAVSVVEPGAVPRSEGKAVRVVDRR